jgi:hypothetical protein
MHYRQGKHDKAKIRTVFYCLWLALAVTQALLFNLIPDETLYWTYSQHLAWGYFEHAPAIAPAIRIGYTIFQNELGVRLISILATCGTIFITEQLTRPVDLLQYYMAVSAFGILHIIGILAVPDPLLLFFTASFFLFFKKYVERDNTLTILLLALNISLLLYSKYHGVLVIIFTLFANLKLIRRRSFWLITLLSAILFLPHVIWQWQNGFPTIVFNLLERDGYHTHTILDALSYLLSVPLIFAPLTGIVFLYFALYTPTTTDLERSLKVSLVGTLVFFFVMALRGGVELNWILCTLTPVIYLGYNAVIKKQWAARFFKISFMISIPIILIGRTVLIDGLWGLDSDLTGWKQWTEQVKEVAGDRPVAFMNSYQKAGEYRFYSGNSAFPLNNIMHRRDQYNYLSFENEAQGKEVMLVTNYHRDGLSALETVKGRLEYTYIRNFRSASDILIEVKQKELTVSDQDSLRLNIILSTRNGANLDVEANPEYPFYVTYRYFNEKGYLSEGRTDLLITNNMLRIDQQQVITIEAPKQSGKFDLYLSASAGWLPGSVNGGKVLIYRR